MTQRNLSLSTLFKSLLFLSVVFAFPACVQQSEDEEPILQDEEVMFRVDLLKINALEIKEAEGETLEVYGLINSKLVRGNITEENALWSVSDTEALGVGLSDSPLVGSVTYTVAAEHVASSNLEVIADLFDYDGGGTNAPEDLGKEGISTPLSNIATTVTYQIVLNDSGGQLVQLTYSITRL